MNRNRPDLARACGCVLTLWLVVVDPSAAHAQPAPSAEPTLAVGVQQVQDGDFETAVLTLDAVVRQLTSRPGSEKDAAKAYLNLGAAYLNLGQQTLAQFRFQQALQSDPSLEVRPDEFPLKVTRAFKEARRLLLEKRTLQKKATRPRGKGALVVAGIGTVAAGGVALAITRERENTAPTAEILVAPDGVAIVGLTTLGFSARGTDAEGDAISYEWAFGDGTTAVGAAVSHIYEQTGTGGYSVSLTASDGLTTTEVRRDVTVGSLGGRWRLSTGIVEGVTHVTLPSGGGPRLDGRIEPVGASCYGVASDPRSALFNCHLDQAAQGGWTCALSFRGEADAALRTISGSLNCIDLGGYRCGRCQGEQPFTLTRE